MRLSERIATPLRKLRKTGFGHLVGSSVINKVLSFACSFLLVRIIPKEEYGIYANADNILGIFCLLEGFGMTSTLLQFGCTNEGEKKRAIWTYCFYIAIVFQVLLSISILCTALFIPIKIAGTNALLASMAFLPLPRLVRDMQQVYLRTELKNKEYAYSNTFSTLASVVLSCSLSLVFHAKGLVLAGYLTAAVTIVFIWGKGGVRFPAISHGAELEKRERRRILKFSAVCVVNNSTSSLMYLLDTFVLGIVIASSTVTASYKVASKIPTALAFIPTCLMTYIYPYFARHKEDGKWCLAQYKRISICFGAFNIALAGGLVACAPLVIRVVFGSQYLDAVVPFRLLCMNYAVQAIAMVSGQLIVSQEKLLFNTFMGVASGVLNTTLNLMLIPLYSSTGAAVATVVTTVITGGISMVYLIRLFRRKGKNGRL